MLHTGIEDVYIQLEQLFSSHQQIGQTTKPCLLHFENEKNHLFMFFIMEQNGSYEGLMAILVCI